MNDLKIERMKKEPKYIAFSTQKGGAGKTTLTVLVASYLHYVMDYNVAVVDCDYPQHSIVEMRERDLKMAMDDPYYKRMAYEQVQRLKKKAYPVTRTLTLSSLTCRELSTTAVWCAHWHGWTISSPLYRLTGW